MKCNRFFLFIIMELYCVIHHFSCASLTNSLCLSLTSFNFSLQLDAGVPEKISLVSRDEKSVLVVTYSDLKRCFESTFQELLAATNGHL